MSDLSFRRLNLPAKTRVSALSISEDSIFILTYSHSLYVSDHEFNRVNIFSLSDIREEIIQLVLYDVFILMIGKLGTIYEWKNGVSQSICKLPNCITFISSQINENQLLVVYSDIVYMVNLQRAQEEPIYRQIFQSNEPIECADASNSKLLISTLKNYYMVDLKDGNSTKIGQTEKKSKYGCVIHDGSMFCGRPNGVMWKVNQNTGKVETSYQFTYEDQKVQVNNNQKIRIGSLYSLGQYVISCTNQEIYVIDMMSRILTRKINMVAQFVAHHHQLSVLYTSDGELWLAQVVTLQQSFNIHLEYDIKYASYIFMNHLNNFSNAISLLNLKVHLGNNVENSIKNVLIQDSPIYQQLQQEFKKIVVIQSSDIKITAFQRPYIIYELSNTKMTNELKKINALQFSLKFNSDQQNAQSMIDSYKSERSYQSRLKIQIRKIQQNQIIPLSMIHSNNEMKILFILWMLPLQIVQNILMNGWDQELRHIRSRFLQEKFIIPLRLETFYFYQLIRAIKTKQIQQQMNKLYKPLNISFIQKIQNLFTSELIRGCEQVNLSNRNTL